MMVGSAFRRTLPVLQRGGRDHDWSVVPSPTGSARVDIQNVSTCVLPASRRQEKKTGRSVCSSRQYASKSATDTYTRIQSLPVWYPALPSPVASPGGKNSMKTDLTGAVSGFFAATV